MRCTARAARPENACRGTAILEFALVLWLLVFFCAGVTELGLVLEERSVMLEAAGAGAQAASMYPAPTSLVDTPEDQRYAIQLVALTAANQTLSGSLFVDPADYFVFVRGGTIIDAPSVRVVIQRRRPRQGLFALPGWQSALNWSLPCLSSELITRSGMKPEENVVQQGTAVLQPIC
ncbi:MAG TPA: pilus assembly protein [Oligoflexia bacterium]|nr:pilus assembly protein [Oligoflexia bacterium]